MSSSAASADKQPLYEAITEDGKPGWTKYFENFIEPDSNAKSHPFSTVDQDGRPKVRYVVHRFRTPESSVLGLTTDVRMQKFKHLKANPHCEACMWSAEPNVQFRISGQAFVLPHNADTDAKAKEELAAIVKKFGRGKEATADFWIEKREEMWKKQSGHLRASFARPTPGSKLSDQDSKPEDWPETIKAEGETEEDKKVIAFAKSNFALVAIAPEDVELLELKVIPNRRHTWSRADLGSDDWSIVAQCP